VATGGRWWAVWNEYVGTQLELFQAYTIGGTGHGRQRITTNPLRDWGPTLALTPGSTFPLNLIWVRGGPEAGQPETQTDLRRGLGNASGTWSSSNLAARVDGVWTGAFASPANLPRAQLLVGLVPQDGQGNGAEHQLRFPPLRHHRNLTKRPVRRPLRSAVEISGRRDPRRRLEAMGRCRPASRRVVAARRPVHVRLGVGPGTLIVDSPRPARTTTMSAGSAEGLLSRCTTPFGT
jgi:hypothetical protein